MDVRICALFGNDPGKLRETRAAGHPRSGCQGYHRTGRQLVECPWHGIKDAAKFASYYAPDASLYVTGLPAMHGTEGISKGLKEFMADPNFSSTFKTSRVHVAKSGDLACSEGTYEQTATDPASKKKVSEKGNYVTCWMKQADGNWKAIADITAAEPAAKAPAAGAKKRGAAFNKKKASKRK